MMQVDFLLDYSQKLLIEDIISKKDENIMSMSLENQYLEI